ncbi:MAG: ABC transporter permease [Agriterribacter sp.]
MIKNYLKIAVRNLTRNKGFSITNLVGLSLGITCAIFIFLWVKDELGYDKFHKNYDNIRVVIANRDFKNRVFTDYNMVLPLAQAIEGKHPQIVHAVVTTQPGEQILSSGDTRIKKTGITVSDHFFDVFSWKVLQGNAAAALKDPSSVILTKSTAKAVFGNTDPINKVIKLNNEQNATVSAIIDDLPGNSSLEFDFLQPFNYSEARTTRMMQNWDGSSWRVYVQTIPGANAQVVDKFIHDLKRQNSPDDLVSTYFTFPMSKWRLQSEFKDGKNIGGMIEYVRLFTIIAIVILLIACVNFMNLSTARSEKRSKEVGIRKTLGSLRLQLVSQFFTESILLVCLSFIISLITVLLLLPAFNKMVSKTIVLNFADPLLWLGALAIILFTGITAGSYPALYLSSFNPAKVLKGAFQAGKKVVLPRHVLVVAQFTISIVLITATIIVYLQIQHIKNRHMGYESDNLVMVPATGDIGKNYTAIKQELLSSGMVASVTRTSSPITEVWWKSNAPDWNGKPADMTLIISGLRTDVDFSNTMGIKMLQGKDFSSMPSDTSSVLLNQAAVEAMNLTQPIGMEMRFGDDKYNVIGITDNVVMESPFHPVDPMLVFYNPTATGFVSVRVKKEVAMPKAIQKFESVFKKHNTDFPFDYSFADAEFSRKFITEDLIGKITNIFAALAVFICCIGLAGLASFTIEKRFREIGIRKILGASVSKILLLISKEFLKLVFIAFVIAVPLAWWMMYNWLEQYTFRIGISYWIFISVGVLILLLALVVVSLHTLKAATSNPVKALRTE